MSAAHSTEYVRLQGKLNREELPQKGSREFSKNGHEIDQKSYCVEVEMFDELLPDENVEKDLRDKVELGNHNAKYLLGQFLFQRERFQEAKEMFEEIQDDDPEAQYQLAVIYYDGLATTPDYKAAVSLMRSLATSEDPKVYHLVSCAQYNLGRAYFEGFGVHQSDEAAESWWLLAAKDGDADGSVKAQSTLGMFYARVGEDSYNMDKAHFWHQEATGNGSIESQAALGVMYEHGLGVPKNAKASFLCYKGAAERGNIYAIGNLAFYYYRQKLYRNAAEVARAAILIEEPEYTAQKTECLEHYVKKGAALACFIYGRCLHEGRGIRRNVDEAPKWYSKAVCFDLDVANEMQQLMTHGHI